MVGIEFCRTFLKIPVEVGRSRTWGLKPNSISRFAGVSIGGLQFPKLAGLDHLMQPRNLFATPSLGAVLDNDSILLMSLHRTTPLIDVMAHGLFDVHMLSGLIPPRSS